MNDANSFLTLFNLACVFFLLLPSPSTLALTAAPSRPVPPKNVNFGNESILSDTTSQSSHDITGHSGTFSTTVTPAVQSEMKDIRLQEEKQDENMAPGEGEKSHSIQTASQSPFSSTTHSSSLLPSSSSEGKSEGKFA